MTFPAPEIASPRLVETAPAKVNLCLHVLGRRADGYHLLDGLTAFAGVGDHLSVAEGDGLSLSISGPFAGGLDTGEENLVLRAARSLGEALGEKRGAAFHLEKRLPLASGIGGGSADAAAALRLLQRLWDREVPREDLLRLALDLGADLPVCLKGRAAFVGGIGEKIEPAPVLPPAWLLLANPGVGLSTPQVFRALDGAFSAAVERPAAWPDARALAAWLARQRNDLEAPASTLSPAIREVLAALAAQPGALLARMSGSGATCFALFERKGEAEAAGQALAQAQPQWWVQPAALLDRAVI